MTESIVFLAFPLKRLRSLAADSQSCAPVKGFPVFISRRFLESLLVLLEKYLS